MSTAMPYPDIVAPPMALSMPTDYTLPTFMGASSSIAEPSTSLSGNVMPMFDGTTLPSDGPNMQTLDPQLSFTELKTFEAWLHDLEEIKDAIGSEAQVCCSS